MTTVKYVDLDEEIRLDVGRRAREARMALGFARTLLARSGYVQIRFDQYRHPVTKVMVETGYTYGETRLVVHGYKYDRPEVTDFRMVGGELQNQKLKSFEDLITRDLVSVAAG